MPIAQSQSEPQSFESSTAFVNSPHACVMRRPSHTVQTDTTSQVAVPCRETHAAWDHRAVRDTRATQRISVREVPMAAGWPTWPR